MKNVIKKCALLFIAVLAIISCQDDEHEFGDLKTPTGLEILVSIQGQDEANPNGDGSGNVTFTATAENAISYTYTFSDQTTIVSPSGILTKPFTVTGTHIYTVTVIANGKGGVSSSKTFDITVFSNFSSPETITALTGGTSKKWYWAASEVGHLGVGPNNDDPITNYYGNYYQAQPFEKAGSPASSCLYENELTFTLEGTTIKYTLNNQGHTFFNAAFESVVNGTAGSDNCYDYDTSGVKTVQLAPSNSVVDPSRTTGVQMTFSDNGFMGYYIGQSTYEILSLTDNRMVVRAVMGGNPALAWYHIFTTQNPTQGSGDDDFTDLAFSDEFNVDGAPDATKWNYNLGATGWGNNEVQSYTQNADNVIVQGGVLKITAKKVGSGYTSARLKSEGLFDFKYGKIEFRAKLPTGGGTWPAIWMLGSNYTTNAWPACGEIDMMEHVGNQQNVIFSTLHYPGHSGGDGVSNNTTVPTASTDFHVYTATWSATSIKFYVDGTLYHSFANNAGTPFNANFFLIMNVAMGGNFGGTIDPAFTQSTMEVDYIRVYQ